MSKATVSIACATFPEILEQLWEARHDGDVIVRFSGGKPQHIELLTRRRVWCAEQRVDYDSGCLQTPARASRRPV
jgi:hypothetical protein